MLFDGLHIQTNQLTHSQLQLAGGTAIELVEHLQADTWMAGEDGRGERVQLLLGNRLALVDFLQGRVGSQHAVEDVLETAPVDHGLVGAGNGDDTLCLLHTAIGGVSAWGGIERTIARLAVLHDAAQFLPRALQLAHVCIEPEVGAAHLGNQGILLAHGLDIDGELVDLFQQGDLAILETAGLLHQAALDTGNEFVERGGMFVAQYTSRHQRGDGGHQQVLGFGVELLQLVALLQLVHCTQLTLNGNTARRQVVDVGTQQLDGGIEGSGMVMLEGGLR
ncbi:hypothetical protein FQZ97_804260 [compost metagenome]